MTTKELSAVKTARTEPTTLAPPHEPHDGRKVGAIADSMRADGWEGAPLLVEGDRALTGSHRIAAAHEAGLETVPVHDVREVIVALGESPAEYEADEARTDPAELMCEAGDIDGETLWRVSGMSYYGDEF